MSHIAPAPKGHPQTEATRAKISKTLKGRKMTDEHRKNLSIAARSRSLDHKRHLSEANRNKYRGVYVGEGQPSGDYKVLATQQHPLVRRWQQVPEHQKILYDTVGPGPHPCYWNDTYLCGKLELDWQNGQAGIVVDHLDGDTTNNSPSNLAVSCNGCNLRRSGYKLTAKDVLDIRRLRSEGLTHRSIGELFGITTAHVWCIVHRRAWAWVQ